MKLNLIVLLLSSVICLSLRANIPENLDEKTPVIVYLAGGIKKDSDKTNELYWSQQDIDEIRRGLNKFEVVFLNPAAPVQDSSNTRAIFGRDMHYVSSSTIVFVDARDRRGLGVGAEMMWAKVHKIPVVTWSPKNSHYNRVQKSLPDGSEKSMVHPFVSELSDHVADNLNEAIVWIAQYLSNPKAFSIKDTTSIDSSIEYYKACSTS